MADEQTVDKCLGELRANWRTQFSKDFSALIAARWKDRPADDWRYATDLLLAGREKSPVLASVARCFAAAAGRVREPRPDEEARGEESPTERTVTVCPCCDQIGFFSDLVRHLLREHGLSMGEVGRWAAALKLVREGAAPPDPVQIELGQSFRAALNERIGVVPAGSVIAEAATVGEVEDGHGTPS